MTLKVTVKNNKRRSFEKQQNRYTATSGILTAMRAEVTTLKKRLILFKKAAQHCALSSPISANLKSALLSCAKGMANSQLPSRCV